MTYVIHANSCISFTIYYCKLPNQFQVEVPYQSLCCLYALHQAKVYTKNSVNKIFANQNFVYPIHQILNFNVSYY